MNSNEIKTIIQPVLEVCQSLVPALLLVVGAVGALWCILLGVKYAKADDPQEHEKAKKGLVHAIIGFVLIFVLLVMLNVAIDIFTPWYQEYNI